MEEITVFMDDGYQDNACDQAEFANADLEEIIRCCVARWPATPPIAWAPKSIHGNRYATLFDESIAAGRVIKLIDGKYVPFGVSAPVVEEKALDIDPRFAAAHYMDGRDLHQADAAMILRDGPAKPYIAPAIVQAPGTSHAPLSALSLSPDREGAGGDVRLGGRFGSVAVHAPSVFRSSK